MQDIELLARVGCRRGRGKWVWQTPSVGTDEASLCPGHKEGYVPQPSGRWGGQLVPGSLVVNQSNMGTPGRNR